MSGIGNARDMDQAEAAYLVEIALVGESAPVLMLSDRNISAGGADYQDYVLAVDGAGGELRRDTAESLNSPVRIALRNDPFGPYAYLVEMDAEYPFAGAGVTIYETYITPEGASDPVELIRGVLEEPRGIGPAEFSVRVSGALYAAGRAY